MQKPHSIEWGPEIRSGSDLLSQAVTSQVPSALEGLTSVFGMGTGVAPPPLPPETFFSLPCLAIFDLREVRETNLSARVEASTY
jgi:hypothetical protein